MQTILSKVTVLFVNTMQITGLIFGAIFMTVEIWGPFNDMISKALNALAYTTVMTFMVAELTLAGTKYLSIYHNNIIANLDDEVIAKKIVQVITCLPSLLTCVEFTLLTEITSTMGFHAVLYDFDSNHNTTRGVFVSILAFVLLSGFGIFLFRFEMDHVQRNEDEGLLYNLRQWFCIQGNTTESCFGLKVIVVRILVAIGTMLAIILLLGRANSVVNIGLLYATHHAVAPMLVVCNHRGMRYLFISRLTSLFSCCLSNFYVLNV